MDGAIRKSFMANSEYGLNQWDEIGASLPKQTFIYKISGELRVSSHDIYFGSRC
ncbi:hypothetical protein GCM10007931_17340 [Vibrio algivorus]|uniref:Uncharacterized protein n=1 Tax=Vibrio algivorus TaxID=1667024 RepID=A0ABQ6EP69_9VIBR|nr:hypothetical protein GCM10007931_17340 [Vibrio algivorus]